MTPDVTLPRREKLAERLNDGENIILFANSKGELEKFSQDNNFLYFTGLNHPELIYTAGKFGGKFNDMLFIERSNPEREVWDGKKLTADEATQISGIKRVKYLDEFYAVLSTMCPMMKKIYSNLGFVSLTKPMTYPMYMLEPLRIRHPQIEINQVNDMAAPLRKVKDDFEILQIQKAIDITGKGILDAMESARAQMMEYELEAMLYYRMQRSGVQHWGFAPIIAAGINAATLHYGNNDCLIEVGDLVLMDVGASYNNYSADITRCFPISANFTSRQRQIYQSVLDVQKEIISMIKPGVLLSTLNITTRDLLAEKMISIGLIESADQIEKYYMHSVSHFLGMDTHDLGGREAVLEIGNVITVEPGIYIPEEKLGVRIEDDVLVTEDGFCVLSQNIPKEIDEIEDIRRNALS
ncbi:MAG: Xaa-Pro aminopeptidase [Candidatus Cloacimonadaceae bacterium]|nr:Xaa-Pro aminopeptidase [Candidatus Cloacimonadaceae bacterium]MDP3113230.1 Xaa-Pro aminopeptidase [Candidatus Cloacimonadaceae bacterium]